MEAEPEDSCSKNVLRSAQEDPQVRTSVVHLGQELLKVLHGSELRADGPEVLHVIAKVPHGGTIQRTDPH